MTDREMLELAAEAMQKANDPNFANFEVVDHAVCLELGSRRGAITSYWNPLTNPADTAEMCAALEIDTVWHDQLVTCINIDTDPRYEPHDNTTEGKLAAWMRASTRAAAEVALNRRKG